MQHFNNGHATEHSPNSSHLSVHSDVPSDSTAPNSAAVAAAAALVARTHKQQTTQQVTTVTKVVREVKHLGDTGAWSQYINYNHLDQQNSHGQPSQAHDLYVHGNNTAANAGIADPQYHTHSHMHPDAAATDWNAVAVDYNHYPSTQYANSGPYGTSIGATYEYSGGVNDHRPESPGDDKQAQHNIIPAGVAYLQAPYHDELSDFRITPSPGGPMLDHRYQDDSANMVYGYVSSPYGTTNPAAGYLVHHSGFATSGKFSEEDALQKHMSHMAIVDSDQQQQQRGSAASAAVSASMRWRDPNLTEVISFLNNPNNVIKANAAAYLQHLCYMDDPNKQRTRTLGGIPPLVKLLSHDSPEVYRNACGALRNLSYGRQNDENKRAIKNAGGIIALINLLRRTTESEVKELVTGVIWNMSSCEDLKRSIIDDGVSVIVTYILIPHSGWDVNSPGDPCYSTVFRNASGVLRNVSSAGEYARTKLRDCPGLVDSLLYVVRAAIEKSNIGNKIVENCVCILRNLSYRCQEVEDPNYDKHPLPTQSRTTNSSQSSSSAGGGTGGASSSSSSSSSSKGDNLGCFGASKKKKDANNEYKDSLSGSANAANGSAGGTTSRSSSQRQEPIKGYELLWQPEVIQSYLALLQSCSNPETLEAAAGAIQNLAACYWQPSIEIRAAVRKEKGLPILVELLRMEVDRVVCAVATALRNLAIDQRNKELIGKYAMRDLVQKLPSGNPQHDQGTSDDTIAAVLATLNEVIKKNAEFSRSLLDAGGVERLMNITRQRQKYTNRVLKFAGQVLFTMWQHQELRDVYKKHGWKEQDFVTKTIAARNAAPNSPNNANSTLNRPMASQSGTRYEDRTIKRNAGGSQQQSMTASGQAQPQQAPVNNIGNLHYQHNDELGLSADMAYADASAQQQQVRVYPNGPNQQQPPSVSH
ncbi:catenin delta-2 isoform X2 [Sitodiplosis mosellana]|uniref:catenin delta-2 isoform X2 n=1 Tax=Sitodiplosis mosellana TaxID=263140 RepID=UPI002444FBDE|nr:catenin delta-2 isoform X2 [Sitodiplosis mosellana]